MDDDLDNLIADSLGGVQSALDAERKAAQPATSSQEWAKEAVRELKDGSRPDTADGQPPNEEFFCNLVKTFQDEKFQKAMADALQATPPADTDKSVAAVAEGAAAEGPLAGAAAAASSSSKGVGGGGGSSSSGGGDLSEEFLHNFLKSFEGAVGDDGNFEKSLNSLMTSMLSTELICDPIKQITDKYEPWLKSQKGLPQSERSRYEGQLRMYRQILHVYSQSPDPLPEAARGEVQRLLTELHTLGQPPDEIMREVAPKGAEEGTENFEDFMKQLGLDSSLGAAEHDLLKKLTEDPEELTKAMKEMTDGQEEACKQQ